jgi:hypothetical protein
MNRDEYLSFISEIEELETLLAEIPVDNVLERVSFEARLKSAKSAIAGIAETTLSYKAQLTFRGKPVCGSHGIAADFGSKAATAFSEAVTAIAAGLKDYLQDTGPIPDKQKNQLLITGIAIGSFGFEFELPKVEAEGLSSEQKNVEKAIKTLQELFKRAAEGSDDDIAEVIDEIHPRALKKTADFLSYVAQHDAWCALDFKDQSFCFQNLEQLEASSKRLQENNIHERSENYIGEFQGVLPSSRTFEFKTEDPMTIIKGKIGQEIKDPDVLNRKYLHKSIRVEMNITQVGTGKPRFTLLSLDKIHLI